MLLGNTVKFTEVTLGLVPKVLDAVDVIFPLGKELGMIDPQMPEARHSEGVVARQRVAINDGIRHDPFF